MSVSLSDKFRKGIAESVNAVQSLTGHIAALESMAGMIRESLEGGGKVMTAGNGGSAAEALHMSEELVGRFRSDRPSLAGVCLCADCTALTCIGNDYGYDDIFSRQIEGIGRAGDVLVVFSTSGNAMNLKKAVDAARNRGCKVVALLGKTGGRLAGLADVEIIVEGAATEKVQEAHQVVLHLVLDALEDVRPRF